MLGGNNVNHVFDHHYNRMQAFGIAGLDGDLFFDHQDNIELALEEQYRRHRQRNRRAHVNGR